jgi:hypothetical protein
MHRSRSSRSVPDGIGERLLRDPEQAQRDIGTDRVEILRGADRNFELMLLFDVGAVALQGRP